MPFRTPRTQAEKIGTDPAKFEGESPVCPECGIPHGAGMPHPSKPREERANPSNPAPKYPEVKNLR
jgi:hypothetical protein